MLIACSYSDRPKKSLPFVLYSFASEHNSSISSGVNLGVSFSGCLSILSSEDILWIARSFNRCTKVDETSPFQVCAYLAHTHNNLRCALYVIYNVFLFYFYTNVININILIYLLPSISISILIVL